ncbi:glycoside hydrolase family 57 protein [Candidatus Woesearchaeota archaeon]|nr:glycoside hydrolase family 57 protein [Candidatus Woesearchaeota archaeon]
MVSVCFYFQVHQPIRLGKYSVFEIGHHNNYFDDHKNEAIIRKVARKCYIPANNAVLELINKSDGRFKVAYSMTGIALEQLEKYTPEVIDSFRKLVDTGCVEILDETYHHTLSFLYSKEEFKEQVELHNRKIRQMFNYKPTVFRNTELVYNNELASFVEKMGYKGILAEGADHILQWRSPNFVYRPKGLSKIKLLLKNYRLSDDIAFRFSEKRWEEFPLTAPKFARWISKVNGNGNVVNLFMDYETFGEHQWEDKGIFEFLRHLPWEIFKHRDNDFVTPSEAIKRHDAVAELDFHHYVSWADIERDLSAWLGNKMQQEAIREIYLLETAVKLSRNPALIDEWRKLQTSDHFYYMCTKWFNDGDVHKYFNPYDSPYEAFIAYMNILNDFRIKANKLSEVNVID